ncbi:hypothetical protein C8R45DRAFT_985646 [Mycena sanguinolenta]|nr:hypothetical protein C8R45DRAFT_985646 [Mycena sanguinolenta]
MLSHISIRVNTGVNDTGVNDTGNNDIGNNDSGNNNIGNNNNGNNNHGNNNNGDNNIGDNNNGNNHTDIGTTTLSVNTAPASSSLQNTFPPTTTPTTDFFSSQTQSSFFPTGSDPSTTTGTSSGVPSVPQSTPFSPSYSISVTTAARRHKLPSAAVAGIAVAVIVLLLCTGITLFWQIRRRRLQRSVEKLFGKMNMRTISSFTLLVEPRSLSNGNAMDADSSARGITPSAIARERLETQLRAATEKMVELEELAERGTTSDGRGSRPPSIVSTLAVPPPYPEAELRGTRELTNTLMARMNALDFTWGMGGSEPPPEHRDGLP